MGTKITDFPNVKQEYTFGDIPNGTIFKAKTNCFYYIKTVCEFRRVDGVLGYNAVRLDDGFPAYVPADIMVDVVTEVTMHYAEH